MAVRTGLVTYNNQFPLGERFVARRRAAAAAPCAHSRDRSAGIPAYGQRFEFTHTIPEILAEYRLEDRRKSSSRQVRVRIAGRMQTIRRMGKAGFAHLAQNGERLQIYVKKDAVPRERFRAVSTAGHRRHRRRGGLPVPHANGRA